MEARALQQVKVANPTAVIDEDLRPPSMASPAVNAASPAEPVKTFASVVRGIAVEKEGQTVPAVLLPKPVRISRPKRQASRKTSRKRVTSSLAARGRGAGKPARTLGGLSSLADVLVSLNPQLANAIKAIERTLRPLLALVPLVRRVKGSSTR